MLLRYLLDKTTRKGTSSHGTDDWPRNILRVPGGAAGSVRIFQAKKTLNQIPGAP
jgi:hypothetical protein